MPKKGMFTADTYAAIMQYVDDGLKPAEIALKVGCTLGTLRVRCSQRGISLRPRRGAAGQHVRATVRLPSHVMVLLDAHAKSKGMYTHQLMSALIVLVATDNLYDAIIDH